MLCNGIVRHNEYDVRLTMVGVYMPLLYWGRYYDHNMVAYSVIDA